MADAPFLPRVTCGRIVLEKARWRVSQEELERLTNVTGEARFQFIQQWRAERRLPRVVVLADGDNTLPVDLDNALSLEAFLHIVKGRANATLQELWPAPEQLCAQNREGRFAHELIVPFVRNAKFLDSGIPHSAFHIPHSKVRRFAPGSEWFYAKLYCGTATADQVLREVVAPVAEKALAEGSAKQWFFLRYGDPHWHLRLRLQGEAQTLREVVEPALYEALQPLLDDGRIWRVQRDTYEREIERYGGAMGVALSEALFHADSVAAAEIVGLLDAGDAGLDERWRLTVRGMDQLLDDLGFDLSAKLEIAQRARKNFHREFGADEDFIGALGNRFRPERSRLTTLLDRTCDGESEFALGFEVFARRSQTLAPIAAALRAAERDGQLSQPLTALAGSYLHMHANRMLRSVQRAQELVIYEFLTRLYESQLARVRAPRAMAQAAGKTRG